MEIREARSDDNDELIALQMACPQGKKLVVSVVNTPDFFVRAKAYESCTVYNATDGGRVIGSIAIAIRNAFVNGKLSRVGYGFQAFVSSEYRRKRVIYQLQQKAIRYAAQQGADLIYSLVIDDNTPAMVWLKQTGFELHRKPIMTGMAVYREMDVRGSGTIRKAMPEDLPAVAAILNETWQGYELYGTYSAESLFQFINRTPGYDLDNLLILQEGGEIKACLGYWDWSKAMRVTVEAVTLKIRMIGLLVKVAGIFRTMPQPPKVGDVLKQIILMPIGFRDPKHLTALLRTLNNEALQRGIGQIFCICERDHEILKSMRGFIRINTTYNLFVKTLQSPGLKTDKPVYIDGIDL